MYRAINLLWIHGVFLTFACGACLGIEPNTVVGVGQEQPITAPNPYFTDLELDDGSTIYFDPALSEVNMTIVNLTLHGKSTIDLTPRVPPPTVPAAKRSQPQAPYTEAGSVGVMGDEGTAGKNGIKLNLRIVNVPNAADGSLWIRTDGTMGGPGGKGGQGGMGGGAVDHALSCGDAGSGGDGGKGGRGGHGSDTAQVDVIIGPEPNTVHVPAGRSPGYSPSARPSTLNLPSAVLVQGAPGRGGDGGEGGQGGAGGPGMHCGGFLKRDGNAGSPGSKGGTGDKGADGNFIPTANR